MRYSISPQRNIIGDIGGLIARFCEELVGSFYPRVVSKRANTVISELFNNAVENNADPAGAITLEVQIDGAILRIRMTNVAPQEQFEKVKKHIDQINTADIRRLMAETIREKETPAQGRAWSHAVGVGEQVADIGGLPRPVPHRRI